MPSVFSHTEFCDIWILQLQCTCCYRRIPMPFPDWRVPFKRVFSPVYQTVCETGCLPSVCVPLERKVVPEINIWENILEMVQESPKLCTYKIAPRISVSRAQVWRTVHEDGLHPHHDQRVSPSWTRGHCATCGFVPLYSSISSTIVILFTDEASFTWDDINSLNLYTWSHGNPHQTKLNNTHMKFCENVQCGLLGNKLIRPFIFDSSSAHNTSEFFMRNELPGLLVLLIWQPSTMSVVILAIPLTTIYSLVLKFLYILCVTAVNFTSSRQLYQVPYSTTSLQKQWILFHHMGMCKTQISSVKISVCEVLTVIFLECLIKCVSYYTFDSSCHAPHNLIVQ